MKKLLFLVLILSAFSLLFFSWNTCLPDGCSFNAPVCSDNSCVNETFGQHIQERSQFLNATIKTDGMLALIIALLFSFILIGYFKDKKALFNRDSLGQKFKINPFPDPFNFLIILFSDGILNPKIH